MNERKRSNLFISWIVGTYLVLMAYVLLQLVFNPSYAVRYGIANGWLLLLGIVAAMGISLLVRGGANRVKRERSGKVGVILFAVVLFIVQWYVYQNICFRSGWDVNRVFQDAMKLADNRPDEMFLLYYGDYPNNIMILNLQALLLKLNKHLGWVGARESIMMLVGVQCALVSFIAYLMAGIVRDMLPPNASASWVWGALILYALLVVFCPWQAVPYTDAMALIVPVALLRLVQLMRRKRLFYVKWICFWAIVYWGYLLKATTIIMMIAVLMIGVCKLPHWVKRISWKRAVICCIFIPATLFVSSNLYHTMAWETEWRIDKERSFGMAHFLMLGMNQKTMGRYSTDDVEFSLSFDSVEERTRANLREAADRISKMGLKGLLEHCNRKLLTNSGDGMFAWGEEGQFVFEEYSNINQTAAPFLKSLLYPGGENAGIFGALRQMVWLFTLFAGFGLVLAFRKTVRGKPEVLIALLSIIGIMLFTMIFEARARYLYCYAPIYVLAATAGWYALWQKLAGADMLKQLWKAKKNPPPAVCSGDGGRQA